ncbi:uncharacterized protein DSM5745_03614 [Aspergillus mulundensis]|uniref:Uncharacterized protein n=1 Tax=Aspergillus mulundensis TaxID=1810919 RepID=A0A3D8SL37_9EURO|nr:Uncharacterized protein DSM5745_03614 [Aspergillus mulundensis]RDW86972.1 Uncharacterized protein DSM5745_03614 [Aspergillus mulundensis]
MHFFRFIAPGLLGTIGALGANEVTATVNATEIQNAADELLSMFPSATPYTVNYTAPGGNLLQPPSSLIKEIITAVPPTVLAQLLVPTGRSSIASEFQAGNTPSWYEDLPTDVKSYVLAMKSQVDEGDVDLNATRTPAPTSTSEGGDSAENDSPASETSSGFASHATGEVAVGLLGALGVLGLAVVL